MIQEIERKFMVKALPKDLKHIKKEFIRQGYLMVAHDQEVRIRQKGECFYQTVKKGTGILRQETEILLEQTQFELLWPLTAGYSLEKTRYTYDWKGYTLEVDQYYGNLEGLFTAEIEFASLKESLKTPMPSFFLEDISFDPRFKNKELVRFSATEFLNLLPLKKTGKIIGTIPFIREKGEIKVVCITNRKKSQWIFPKGQDEHPRLKPEETALLEADEEAGIKGEIYGSPIRIPYIKGNNVYNMLAFPIEVKKLKNNWLEDSFRKRKIIPIKEAYKISDQKAVHYALEYLEILLEKS
jgi:CYTH domain-containing protein/8-oxo-dGTP pyrophosphatase MutT (NUDIX family)